MGGVGDRSFDQIEEGINRCVRKLVQTSLATIDQKKKKKDRNFHQLIYLGGKAIILKEWIPGTQL